MSDFLRSHFQELFGDDNLLCLPPEQAHKLDLAPETVEAFSQFGLPAIFKELSLQFSLKLPQLSTPSHDAFEFRVMGAEGNFSADALYNAIGLEPGEPYTWLCINLTNQAIYSVSNDAIQEVIFVNSSLMTFLECLYEFHQARLRMDESEDDDEILIELIEQLEQKLYMMDSQAFASDANWWPSVCSNFF